MIIAKSRAYRDKSAEKTDTNAVRLPAPSPVEGKPDTTYPMSEATQNLAEEERLGRLT